MKRRIALLLVAVLIVTFLWSQTTEKTAPEPAPSPAPEIKLNQPPGLYAVFDTSMGRVVCRLFPDKAPETVKNFVGLTKGTKRWYDDKKKTWVKRRYYDGLTFHRVIPKFMIQGGDQLGTGSSNVGFTFKDEFSPDLTFADPGKLAMANSGPNTNGGQFFITVAPTEWLNNHHSIFGEVVKGQDVVDMIVQVPRNANDKPQKPVVMRKVTIVDTRGEAKPETPKENQ